MDDLTLIRAFRAERADGDPEARATAWRALEARFELASTTSPAVPARPRRRGLLVLAGAAALSAIVACILVLSSGPTAEPAAAKVLQLTAGVAADSPPDALPGPGQFLYTRTKSLELQGWTRGRPPSFGGTSAWPNAFAALLPTTREFWISPDGVGRSREVLGTPRFFSDAERDRWEQAGAPLPAPFDPSSQDAPPSSEVQVLGARRGVIDVKLPTPKGLGPGLGYPDLSAVPTDPATLRRAIRGREIAGISYSSSGKRTGPQPPLDVEETIGGLWELLGRPNATPALRAAAFGAMAELPGIGLDRGATDLVGRSGYAVTYADGHGLRDEYIFDPGTAAILGQRSVILDPSRTHMWDGIPAGTVIRDTAYLQSEVVDSMRAPGGSGAAGER